MLSEARASRWHLLHFHVHEFLPFKLDQVALILGFQASRVTLISCLLLLYLRSGAPHG